MHGTRFSEAMLEEESTGRSPKVIEKVFVFSSHDLHICYKTVL